MKEKGESRQDCTRYRNFEEQQLSNNLATRAREHAWAA